MFWFIAITLVSCNKDDNPQKNQSNSIGLKRVSLQEIPAMRPVVTNLKKVKTKPVANGRQLPYLDIENLNTDEIFQYTDASGYSTYSFKIEDTTASKNFENLHLIETETGLIAYILSYEPDEDWEPEITHGILNLNSFKGKMTKYSLEREVIWTTESGSQYRGGTIITCTYSMVENCSYGEHNASTGYANCKGYSTQLIQNCTSGVSGSGAGEGSGEGDGEGDGSTGSGGSSGGPCTNTSGTVIGETQPISGVGGGCAPNPVIVVAPTSQEESPCETLKNTIDPNKTALKSHIEALIPKVDEEVEFGIEVKKFQMAGEEDESYTCHDIESVSQNEIPLQIGRFYVTWVHTHPYCVTNAMYSFRDLVFLKDAYKACAEERRSEVTTIIVCKDAVSEEIKVYALKIDDIIAFETKIETTLNHPDFTGLNLSDKIEKIHNDQAKKFERSNNKLEKTFLDQFNGFGISLYKANSDLSNWSKLEIVQNQTEVSETPCN